VGGHQYPLGLGSQDPPDLEEMEFKAIVSCYKKTLKVLMPRFVKRTKKNLEVMLPPIASRHEDITLVERGLINKFTSIWPSPRAMVTWLQKNWKVLIKR
jgi:hypothetical protein